MPELDSHSPTPDNPTPLASQYSRWHAAGTDHASYSKGMQRCSHLKLVGATCRLASGDIDVRAAAAKWQSLFGVECVDDGVAFTNAELRFVPGCNGKADGLESITIQMPSQQQYEEAVEAAKKAGVWNGSSIGMLGLTWNLVTKEPPSRSKL